MKLTKFLVLRRGIRYWLMVVCNISFMPFTLFYNLRFCFWDTIIRVIKVKYKVNEIYVIKAKDQLLVLLIY